MLRDWYCVYYATTGIPISDAHLAKPPNLSETDDNLMETLAELLGSGGTMSGWYGSCRILCWALSLIDGSGSYILSVSSIPKPMLLLCGTNPQQQPLARRRTYSYHLTKMAQRRRHNGSLSGEIDNPPPATTKAGQRRRAREARRAAVEQRAGCRHVYLATDRFIGNPQ